MPVRSMAFQMLVPLLLTAVLSACAGGRESETTRLKPPEATSPPNWLEEPPKPDHLALARDLLRLGHYAVAMRQLQKALETEAENPEIHCLTGICLRETGDFAAARDSFRRAIALDPGYAPAHAGLGIALYSTGASGAAEIALSRAVALDPACVDCRNNLGVLALRRRDFTEARERFEQCLRLDPRHERSRNNLAECLARMGRDDEALVVLLNRFPPAVACNNLGSIYHAIGHSDAARRMFRRALMHDPGLTAARRNLDRIGAAQTEKKEVTP